MLIRFRHTALHLVVIVIWPQTVDMHAATAADFWIVSRGDVIWTGFFGEFDALARALFAVKPAVKYAPYVVRAWRKARYGCVDFACRSHRVVEHFGAALAVRAAMKQFAAAQNAPCSRFNFLASRDVNAVNHI